MVHPKLKPNYRSTPKPKSTGEQPTRMVGGGVLSRQERIGGGGQRRVVRVVSILWRVDQLMGRLPGGKEACCGPTWPVEEASLPPRAGWHPRGQNQWRPQGSLGPQGHPTHAGDTAPRGEKSLRLAGGCGGGQAPPFLVRCGIHFIV